MVIPVVSKTVKKEEVVPMFPALSIACKDIT
jgi:hypothetical protein